MEKPNISRETRALNAERLAHAPETFNRGPWAMPARVEAVRRLAQTGRAGLTPFNTIQFYLPHGTLTVWRPPSGRGSASHEAGRVRGTLWRADNKDDAELSRCYICSRLIDAITLYDYQYEARTNELKRAAIYALPYPDAPLDDARIATLPPLICLIGVRGPEGGRRDPRAGYEIPNCIESFRAAPKPPPPGGRAVYYVAWPRWWPFEGGGLTEFRETGNDITQQLLMAWKDGQLL